MTATTNQDLLSRNRLIGLYTIAGDCPESDPADWTWSGSEADPVVSAERITVAGTVMLLQSTQSGLMLLNGRVVEPAAKVAK